jgi:2-polyprenyl-6-methoxyphenol hydroxylase-like FAD-dependent oxidoreductase
MLKEKASANEVAVLIAGGGPVGMTLALDLGCRKVPCLVVEENDRTLDVPRCNTVSARSMEHFRRLGVASRIRQAGLPPDYPTDVSYRTRFCHPDLLRITMPSMAQVLSNADRHADSSPTCEPPHRISQLYLEPILTDHARNYPDVRVEHRVRLEAFDVTTDGVLATLRSTVTGQTKMVYADFLIGCDGASSLVRRLLGAQLTGTTEVCKAVSTYIRTSALAEFNHRRTWMTWTVNRDALSVTIAIDGHKLWLIHTFFPPGTDTSHTDTHTLITQAIGSPIKYQQLGVERWTARRLVANHYGHGHVFLAGDAAHLWVPMAGFGMNIGIGDAAHLAWMLSAERSGWAGPHLLDAYETERRPVAEAVSHFTTGIAEALLTLVNIGDVIEDDSTCGAASRTHLEKIIEAADQGQFRPIGLSFGYHYHGSPLLADDQPPPAFTIDTYDPTTAAGARLPHLRLPDGTPIYDRLGPDFTLLRIGPDSPDPCTLLRAAAARKVPVKVLDIPTDTAVERYAKKLIMVRPDQHVAWRADNPPADPLQLIDRMRGAGVRRVDPSRPMRRDIDTNS